MILNKDIISSRNNAFVKWAVSLQDKKGRNESNSFIAEGVKLSFEAIEAGLPLTHVLVAKSRTNQYLDKLKESRCTEKYEKTEIVILEDDVFEKISTEKAPQGVISIIKYLDFFSDMDIIYKEDFFLPKDEKVIILCSVRDPSNIGAAIRSSVAFGTERIILTDDCADIYNPKTVRSAMGSMFRVKITRISNLASLIDALKENGRRVFAAELTKNSVSLNDMDIRSNDCFIIGNEGHGIPREISDMCTNSVYIPISNKTESLNASVAAAIIMWEQNKA